jgi:hypothetical protein
MRHMTIIRSATTQDVARLARHVKRLHGHRYGEPYPGLELERAWVMAHLPRDKADFDRVVDAVRETAWSQVHETDVAALLLDIFVYAVSEVEFAFAKHARIDLEVIWLATTKIVRHTYCYTSDTLH